jgi:hypothetical protein
MIAKNLLKKWLLKKLRKQAKTSRRNQQLRNPKKKK